MALVLLLGGRQGEVTQLEEVFFWTIINLEVNIFSLYRFNPSHFT